MRCHICQWPGAITGSARMSAPTTLPLWPRATSITGRLRFTAGPTKSSAISSRKWCSDFESRNLHLGGGNAEHGANIDGHWQNLESGSAVRSVFQVYGYG